MKITAEERAKLQRAIDAAVEANDAAAEKTARKALADAEARA